MQGDPILELQVARRALRVATTSKLVTEQEKQILKNALRDVSMVLKWVRDREAEEKVDER